MFGCATALSTRCRRVISTGTISASVVFNTIVVPSKRVTVRPSSCRSSSGRSGATMSMSGGDAARASSSVKARLSLHRLLGERDVAMTSGGERAGVGRHVLGRLLRHRLVHLLAAALNRMGGADVRAGRHRGDVGRDGEDEAGGGGARARGGDEDRDRCRGGNHPRDDCARRLDEAARRAQREHDQRRPRAIRAIERVDHVFRGDGMDDAVDDGGVDDRGACSSRAASAALRSRGRSAGRLECRRQAQSQGETGKSPRDACSHGGGATQRDYRPSDLYRCTRTNAGDRRGARGSVRRGWRKDRVTCQ